MNTATQEKPKRIPWAEMEDMGLPRPILERLARTGVVRARLTKGYAEISQSELQLAKWRVGVDQ